VWALLLFAVRLECQKAPIVPDSSNLFLAACQALLHGLEDSAMLFVALPLHRSTSLHVDQLV
jgi:hypothetical protein